MGKKATILATACIIIAVVVFFEFYVFTLPNQQTTTVGIITSDPSAWVNKTVVLEGNVDGPLIYPGDWSPPYDCQLNSSGQVIGLSFGASVNLTSLYSNRYVDATTGNGSTVRIYFLNSSITVRIHGIVKKGEISNLGPPQVTYYIEAEKVERV
jgi:hypothetical protein